MTLRILFIACISILPYKQMFACGGWDYEADYFAFNLMGDLYQKTDDKLNDDNRYVWGNGGNQYVDEQNIAAWQNYIGSKRSFSDINQLVYFSKLDELIAIRNGDNGNVGSVPESMQTFFTGSYKELLDYLIYAKQCQAFADVRYYDWYSEVDYNAEEIEPLIEEGSRLWAQAISKELKLRYGYQLIRLAHYSNKLSLANTFFNKYVSQFNQDHIIYQYAYEQLGGVFKKQGKLGKAAYVFAKVYNKCPTRRGVARTSFGFSLGYGETDTVLNRALQLAKNKNEEIIIRILYGLETNKLSIANIEKLYAVDNENELVRWFLLQIIQGQENKYNDKGNYNSKIEFDAELEQVSGLIEKIVSEKLREDLDYFYLMQAHISFWQKDFSNAVKTLKNIKKRSVVSGERGLLEFAIDLAKLEKVDEKIEKRYFARISEMPYSGTKDELVELWLSTFKRLYKLQGDTAKAYFCFNKTDQFRNNFELSNMYAAEKYLLSGKTFSDFEMFIIGDVEKQKALLLEAMGTYFFRSYALEKAAIYYKKMQEQTNYKIEYVPFSIGYNGPFGKDIYYSRANDWDDAVDGVSVLDEKYFDQYGDLVVEVKTKLDLVEQMLYLERELKDNVNAERKAICGLLLGNIWYNLTGHGAQREVLNYTNNWITQYGQREIYYGYYGMSESYFNRVENADEYYRSIFSYNVSDEINARAAFGLAKCTEAEITMQEGIKYWYSDVSGSIDKFDHLSNPLEEYLNTQYCQEVIAECGYFYTYLNNKK